MLKQTLFSCLRLLHRGLGGRGLTRAPAVRRAYLWILARLRPDTVEVEGATLHVGRLDSLGLTLRDVHEPFETQFVLETLRPGDVVLDIGANIGYYAVLMARRVGPEGRVVAFEPEPENLALLQKNIRINGLANVEVVNAAVADRAGEARLFLSSLNQGDHRLGYGDDGREAVQVPTIAVDEFLRDRSIRPNFIKMDIQGAELLALDGMRGTLAARDDLALLTEFWPKGLHEQGREPAALPNLLDAHGFSAFLIDGRRFVPITSPTKLVALASQDRFGYASVLFAQPNSRWHTAVAGGDS